MEIDMKEIFGRASKINPQKNQFMSVPEWQSTKSLDGARRFKRRALGLCGRSSIKSLDEMAQLLYETGVAPTIQDGRELTPHLAGKSVTYSNYSLMGGEIGFREVTNPESEKAYQVYVFNILSHAR